MASTGISEFTFGFGFLYEQTHSKWSNVKAAPVLPSLQQETDEGWDAHLPLRGTGFYYQFKLSDYLSHKNSKYIKNKIYKDPYYRFALHRKNNNNQHQRLIDHSQNHPHTYYVAPEFTGINNFNQAFLSRQLLQNSRLIPVSKCRSINDNDQHYITYQPGNSAWILHSEPQYNEQSFFGNEIEPLYRQSADAWRTIDVVYAHDLFESIATTVQERIIEAEHVQILLANPEERSRESYLRKSADLLSYYYGLTMVLVGTDG